MFDRKYAPQQKFALIYQAYSTLSENELARHAAKNSARRPVRNTKSFRVCMVLPKFALLRSPSRLPNDFLPFTRVWSEWQ